MSVLKRPWPAIVVVFSLALGLLRWAMPERPALATGPRALLDAGFTLGLWGLTLLLALGAGRAAMRRLRLDGLTLLERLVFRLALGLGIVAYGVLALGLAGLLRPPAILAWLLLLGALTWREWSDLAGRLPAWLATLRCLRNGSRPAVIAICGLAATMFTLSLLQALTPPWDYDGLLYHLEGPRLFLEAGRLVVLPDVWQANGPFTVEMLFTVGLAFDAASFSRLIHLTYAVLLALATYSFGRRYLGPLASWLAMAILIGIPIVPLWAGYAYVDMGWALYEFLGLYALMIWAGRGGRRWLVLAGAYAGLALGCKYMALGNAAALGVWLAWRLRRCGVRTLVAQAAWFAVPALLVAGPWYLKNWLWAGNPIYPLYFGGVGWPAARLDSLMAYLQSFGAGRDPLGFLLLPWNLFARHAAFGTFMGSIEMPSPLFLLALLYPLVRRPRPLDSLAGIVVMRAAMWALGSQQTRFLLPLFPALSLLTAAVFLDLARRPALRRAARVAAAGLTGGMMVVALVYSLLAFVNLRPLGVIVGLESKDAFLRRALDDYAVIRFAQENLAGSERAMMLWDCRGFYANGRLIPDAEPSRWAETIGDRPTVAGTAQRLREAGISHLLFGVLSADFFAQHDPDGQQRKAIEFFLNEFQPACARSIRQEAGAVLYELTCP